MNYVGIDLHKKTITLCVVNEKFTVLARRTLDCCETETITEFFESARTYLPVTIAET
jgi:hypothetical protein